MEPESEYQIAEEIAAIKWPDGFCCRRCGHDRAYHLRCRPRVFECVACGCANSVTARTLMHATKRLDAWVTRGELQDAGEVPTGSRLADLAGVSRSTAWSINHKVMLATSSDGQAAFTTRVRKPSRKPLARHAPGLLRAVWHLLTQGRAAQVTVKLGRDPAVGPAEDHPADPLGLRVAARLLDVHKGVSARWILRWSRHLVALWSEAPRDWLRAALRHPPVTLVNLAPW